jgi:hypothetical protein
MFISFIEDRMRRLLVFCECSKDTIIPCGDISTVSSSRPAKNPSPSAVLVLSVNPRADQKAVENARVASLHRFAGLKSSGGTLIADVYVFKSYMGKIEQ